MVCRTETKDLPLGVQNVLIHDMESNVLVSIFCFLVKLHNDFRSDFRVDLLVLAISAILNS